jgi:hypothetical protein
MDVTFKKCDAVMKRLENWMMEWSFREMTETIYAFACSLLARSYILSVSRGGPRPGQKKGGTHYVDFQCPARRRTLII